jgi:hypothetical protein
MLFTGLQGQHEAALAVLVNGLPHNPARHVADM